RREGCRVRRGAFRSIPRTRKAGKPPCGARRHAPASAARSMSIGGGLSKLPELERRRAAVEMTLARYRGKPFDWSRGITCVHLARAHLRNMGHKPPTVPRFRSALGAKRALKERGWNDVAA